MKKKILVIDDEADVAVELSQILGESGYDVVAATNGQEGIKRAIQERPDVILLDITMPKMSGYDVLRILKTTAEASHIPVIMVTAKGETESILRTQNLQASDYIMKPFVLEDLLRSIKRRILAAPF